MPLRFYQETILFFILALLLLGWGLQASFPPTPSNPLSVVHAKPQEDGGKAHINV